MPYGNCIDCAYCRFLGKTAYQYFKEEQDEAENSRKQDEAYFRQICCLSEEIRKIEEEIDKLSDKTAKQKAALKSSRTRRLRTEITILKYKTGKPSRRPRTTATATDVFECRIRSCVKMLSGDGNRHRVEFPVLEYRDVERRVVGCGEFEPVEDEP